MDWSIQATQMASIGEWSWFPRHSGRKAVKELWSMFRSITGGGLGWGVAERRRCEKKKHGTIGGR